MTMTGINWDLQAYPYKSSRVVDYVPLKEIRRYSDEGYVIGRMCPNKGGYAVLKPFRGAGRGRRLTDAQIAVAESLCAQEFELKRQLKRLAFDFGVTPKHLRYAVLEARNRKVKHRTGKAAIESPDASQRIAP